MKKYYSVLLICSAIVLTSFKSDKPAYHIFNKSGKVISYKKMIKELREADVVLFGEHHNNPIVHWLELEVTQSLFASKDKQLVMGAEMFERDNQLILDEYLKGLISRRKFEAECRLWRNYDTDYAPLIEFAKDSALRFVATNIPRRYAAIVHKQGIDQLNTLSAEAKQYIAPLPIDFDPDSVLIAKMGGMMGKSPLPIAKAQAIKDATMAYSISENMTDGDLFIHFNGSFHSDDDGGLRKYLNIYKSGLKIKTITTVSQDDIGELDSKSLNKADYIICVPSNMTKTYIGMRK